MKSTVILGVNTTYHELSAAIIRDGELIAAVEEERFTRVKHGKSSRVDNPDVIPWNAINYCLEKAVVSLAEVDYIGLPFAPALRLKNADADPYFQEGDWGSETGEKLFYEKIMTVPDLLSAKAGVDIHKRVRWIPHHVAHGASAYYVSPFTEATVLAIDGIGEIDSTWAGHGSGTTLEKLFTVSYPHSLGFVWEKVSEFCGLSEYDASKLMGLASYGNGEKYLKKFEQVIAVQPGGGFTVDIDTFQYRVPNFAPLEELFGVKAIAGVEERTQEHADIAAALQLVTNRVVLHIAREAVERTGSRNICLSGGVALNCVANLELLQSGEFDEIYIQPAAHDAGGALGAAYYIWCHQLGESHRTEMDHAYWGTSYTDEEIEQALRESEVTVWERKEHVEEWAADAIANGKIVGWFQGAMEWGPRALGNRSLLADPRNPSMKEILNLRIKNREAFRPFAPSILAEAAAEWLEVPTATTSRSTEFMEFVFPVRSEKGAQIPAVVHVDGTTRPQFVRKETNPRYHKLISAFAAKTGVPLVLNTSFNDREPIVCSPADAIQTFLRTGIDVLVLGDIVVEREHLTN